MRLRRFTWGRLKRSAGSTLLREHGNATVEFVLVMPAFVMILLASVEAGIILTRSIVLERALDIAVRDVRLGLSGIDTRDEMEARLCANAKLLKNCRDSVVIEMRPISTATWGPLTTPLTCSSSGPDAPKPQVEFRVGVENELMLVRACAIVKPIFPTSGLAAEMTLDDQGNIRITATSAFVNEP